MRFGHWLTQHTSPPHEIVPVHVLEDAYVEVALRYHSIDQVLQQATDSAIEAMRAAGVTDPAPQVIPGTAAESVLTKLAVNELADGILIGRQAPKDRQPLVRLGRVARRLVRHLPRTVVVIPPDFVPDPDADGPILLATDLEPQSAPAARCAQAFATQLQRRLEVVHVVPLAEDFGAHYIPAATLERYREEQSDEGRQDLERWVAAQGLTSVGQRILQGPIIENLVELARHERSPMIVCGSRQLRLVNRVAQASVATELAAAGTCPICIVPPDDPIARDSLPLYSTIPPSDSEPPSASSPPTDTPD